MSQETFTLATPTADFVSNLQVIILREGHKFSEAETSQIASVLYPLFRKQKCQATTEQITAFVAAALQIYADIGVEPVGHVVVQEQFKKRFQDE